MHMNIGMIGEKVFHCIGFMRRQIIRDHVNFLTSRLCSHEIGQEGDKLGASVAPSGFPQDLPGASVKGGIKRERAVTKVFKTVPFGSSRRERQDWILAVQCLNGRFLI